MNWATAPPPMDTVQFTSPLKRMDRYLLDRVVEVLREDHQFSIIHLTQSALGGRHLGSATNIIPEISDSYGRISNHPVKTAVFVQRGIEYQTPRRQGHIRIRGEGERDKWRRETPHLTFCNQLEAEQFGIYGCATLAVVLQVNLLGPHNELLGALERAVKAGRIEKVIILTSVHPSIGWFDPRDLFDSSKVTVKFCRLR